MKLNLSSVINFTKPDPKPIRRKAAPVESRRFSFFLPDDEKAVMLRFIERASGFKLRYTIAYILREGAKKFIREQSMFLSKAERGEFHAKKRKQKVR